MLEALHAGPFLQVGKGRSARWEVAPEEPIPAEVLRYRDAVWKARKSGALSDVEAFELLIFPAPAVMARLVEIAA